MKNPSLFNVLSDFIVQNSNSTEAVNRVSKLLFLKDCLDLGNQTINWLLSQNGKLEEQINDALGDYGCGDTEFSNSIKRFLNGLKSQSDISPDLLQDLTDFWFEHFNPTAGENPTEDVLSFLIRRNFFPDLITFDKFEMAYEEYYGEEEYEEGWPWGEPLTPQKIWEYAGLIKSDLLFRFPNQASRIENFFQCRVLGMAFEDVVLNSLSNFDNRNESLPGISSRPDGYNSLSIRWDPPLGPVVPNSYHIITEVKGKFSIAASPLFDWSGNTSQFNDYLSFLNQNQYEGSAPNMLYLIIPAGVLIDENIITSCTNNNVMLVTSAVQIDPFNAGSVYVSRPIAHNQYDINYHTDQIETLIKWFPTNGLKGLSGEFEYDSVSFVDRLNIRAAQFEYSYLQGQGNVTCPVE